MDVSYHSSLTFFVSGQAQQGFSGFFSVASAAGVVSTPAAHTVDMVSKWSLKIKKKNQHLIILHRRGYIFVISSIMVVSNPLGSMTLRSKAAF